MSNLWFKLTYSLSADVHARRVEDLPATVAAGPYLTFKLWRREIEQRGHIIRQLCLDTILDRQIPQYVRDVLFSLRENLLILDTPPQIELPYIALGGETIVDERGNIRPKRLLNLAEMPARYQEYQRTISRELSQQAKKFFNTLRWLQSASGSHSPFAHVGTYWSANDDNWLRLPSDHRVRMFSPRGIDTEPANLEFAAAEMARGLSEPFAHELIREATRLSSEAPRSALLVAMSALETGLKNYVGSLIPYSEALIEKVPSPPVLVLTQDVIPDIHRGLGVQSSHFPLTRDQADFLRKWIQQRNQVAHGVKRQVDSDGLVEFVSFVRDVLYLIDAHLGHEWALGHVRGQLFTGRNERVGDF